jgi:hypothetical protein
MTRRRRTAKGPKRGPNCQHPSCGLSQCRDGGIQWWAVRDSNPGPLIKRRGPVISRPSVFLRSSVQLRAAAPLLASRFKDRTGLSARSRIEIVVSDGCVQGKSTQALQAPTSFRLSVRCVRSDSGLASRRRGAMTMPVVSRPHGDLANRRVYSRSLPDPSTLRGASLRAAGARLARVGTALHL